MISTQTKDITTVLEMWRHVWWCLYILEAWSGTSLGRPRVGRLESAFTTRYPQQPIVLYSIVPVVL